MVVLVEGCSSSSSSSRIGGGSSTSIPPAASNAYGTATTTSVGALPQAFAHGMPYARYLLEHILYGRCNTQVANYVVLHLHEALVHA